MNFPDGRTTFCLERPEGGTYHSATDTQQIIATLDLLIGQVATPAILRDFGALKAEDESAHALDLLPLVGPVSFEISRAIFHHTVQGVPVEVVVDSLLAPPFTTGTIKIHISPAVGVEAAISIAQRVQFSIKAAPGLSKTTRFLKEVHPEIFESMLV